MNFSNGVSYQKMTEEAMEAYITASICIYIKTVWPCAVGSVIFKPFLFSFATEYTKAIVPQANF